MGIAHLTRTILRVLVFGAVGSLLSTGQALAWHIDTPTVTPDSLVVGVATPVTATALISDPSVLPDSVILQSVDANGHLIAILGNLHDDGEQGDAVAGDHCYTIQTPSLRRPQPRCFCGWRLDSKAAGIAGSPPSSRFPS